MAGVGQQDAPQFRHKDGDPYAGTATGTPEDAEDDDPEEDADSDRCAAGDDHMISGPVAQREFWARYAECTGAQAGDEADAEREQMACDVPMLPVVAIEPNPLDGKRPYLGLSNLMTTFRSNGGELFSADTGRRLKGVGNTDQPRGGAPV